MTVDSDKQRVRCAIYTRKSNEEGLEQDFNSLHAQRESAEAFIESQRHEGWTVLPDRYDDGGFSGGNVDRPALKKLLADIEAGQVDCIVVYKVDRLSRSLLDFAKLVELFEKNNVSFVSVTQQFNTTSSMGRLTLNILLSFAQFEREIAGERIRDKKLASAKKGKYVGGGPILGYDIDHDNRRLVVNQKEAKLVCHIFGRFIELGSAMQVARELNAAGHRTKAWITKAGKRSGGKAWNKSHVYRLINNRKYVGDIVHRGVAYPGEHKAIIDLETWKKAQAVLADHTPVRGRYSPTTPALLRGIIRCGHCGCGMGITFTRRHGRQYRYYLCTRAAKNGYKECPVRSVSAGEIEAVVLKQLRGILASPEMVARTYREAIERVEQDPAFHGEPPSEEDVAAALRQIDPVWNELFPREQQRIVRLLVKQVIVQPDALQVLIRAGGVDALVTEVGTEAAE